MTSFDLTIIKTTLEHQKDNIEDVVVINKGMSNGDVIKAMFPYINIRNDCEKYYSVNLENLSDDESFNTIGIRKEWWNAPYKGAAL